jgi:hypothetical protein
MRRRDAPAFNWSAVGNRTDVPDEDMVAVGEAAHAVIREAKAAGIYVFGGGINSEVASLLVAADGNCTNDTYRQTRGLDGGAQELRELHYDPES